MEYAMRDVVRTTGVTSRALRHYAQLGLLTPSSTGAGGERRYDENGLLRLQRLLLLRDLGLPLDRIRAVLDRESDSETALNDHVVSLRAQRARLAAQIAAVEATIQALQKKRMLSMNDMFDGFNHDQYADEVKRRWGSEAGRASQEWWSELDADQRRTWQTEVVRLNQDWTAAATAGGDPRGEEAQLLAARHVRWLTTVPGTPASKAAASARTAQRADGEGDGGTAGDGDAAGDGEGDGDAAAVRSAEAALREYVLNLADLYLDDPRFASNYGGAPGARFVRSALRAYFGEE